MDVCFAVSSTTRSYAFLSSAERVHSRARCQLERPLGRAGPPRAIESVVIDVAADGVGHEVPDGATGPHAGADVGRRDVEGRDALEGHSMPRHVTESRTAAIIVEGFPCRNGKIVERERPWMRRARDD